MGIMGVDTVIYTYEKMYLSLYKVADTPFYIQGDDLETFAFYTPAMIENTPLSTRSILYFQR